MNNEIRTIICKHTSEMLDHPDKDGIYPTTKFYNDLEKEVERLLLEARLDEARMYIHRSPELTVTRIFYLTAQLEKLKEK